MPEKREVEEREGKNENEYENESTGIMMSFVK